MMLDFEILCSIFRDDFAFFILDLYFSGFYCSLNLLSASLGMIFSLMILGHFAMIVVLFILVDCSLIQNFNIYFLLKAFQQTVLQFQVSPMKVQKFAVQNIFQFRQQIFFHFNCSSNNNSQPMQPSSQHLTPDLILAQV